VSGCNQLFASTARRNSGGSEKPLQSHRI
jgi:hypothetical protein